MSDDKQVRQRMQKIAALIEDIDAIQEPHARAATKELVQLIMEFHGEALDRALEIVAGKGEAGLQTIDDLAGDPLVSSLLVLYGMHPDDTATRVNRAIAETKTKLKREGASVELLSADENGVRVRITLAEHACGSTSEKLKSIVEDAIYEVAPEVASLSIESSHDRPASGFVPLAKLGASDRPLANTIPAPVGVEAALASAEAAEASSLTE